MGIQERKERERERRKKQILLAAKRVFGSKGYGRATMEDIARAAELSPGTLYLYFRNKDELYASLSIRILHQLRLRLKDFQAGPNGPFPARIRRLRDALFEVYESDPLVLINMLHLQASDTLRNLSDPLLLEMQRISGDFLGIIPECFEEGMKEGEITEAYPRSLAELVWAMFSGLVLWEDSKRLISEKKRYLKTTLEVAFDLFARGLVKSRSLKPALEMNP